MNVEPDPSPHTEALEQFRQALLRVCEEATRALTAMCDLLATALVPWAANGIAELEMDLKLRSEVGLRTDLLALFDP